MKHSQSFLGMLMLFGTSACTDNPESVKDMPLVGTRWDLESFETIDGEKSDIGSEGLILTFAEDDTVEGQAYSIENPTISGNHYYGVYSAGSEGSLSIDIIGMTYLGLPPGSRFQEYILALEASSAYQLEGDWLRIFYDDGTKSLNFEGE